METGLSNMAQSMLSMAMLESDSTVLGMLDAFKNRCELTIEGIVCSVLQAKILGCSYIVCKFVNIIVVKKSRAYVRIHVRAWLIRTRRGRRAPPIYAVHYYYIVLCYYLCYLCYYLCWFLAPGLFR